MNQKSSLQRQNIQFTQIDVVCDRPFRAGIVVALGKGSSSGAGVGRGATAALQTQQEAQRQTKNQRDDQVALTIRYLQRKRTKIKSCWQLPYSQLYPMHLKYILFVIKLCI